MFSFTKAFIFMQVGLFIFQGVMRFFMRKVHFYKNYFEIAYVFKIVKEMIGKGLRNHFKLSLTSSFVTV